MLDREQNSQPAVEPLPFQKGDVVTVEQLDEGVHTLVKNALAKGMIPIAGIISRPLEDGRHEYLGGGNNQLRDGIPGVHGETGAIIDMGRIPGGYEDLTATSSLSPCPFCQGCLARQMGIRKIRILNGTKDYEPNLDGYRAEGIEPEVAPHPGIEQVFADWVRREENQTLWARDIGIASGQRELPFSPKDPSFWNSVVARANRLAAEGLAAGEAPIGAVILDKFGEVAGSGYGKIISENDPSKTAAVAAWRNCGSRDDWGSHTLVLSAGPDHIAYSMFKIFRFGQLVVGSDEVYPGQTEAVRSLVHPTSDDSIKPVYTPVHLFKDPESAELLRSWVEDERVPLELKKEFLGADFTR